MTLRSPENSKMHKRPSGYNNIAEQQYSQIVTLNASEDFRLQPGLIKNKNAQSSQRKPIDLKQFSTTP